VIIDYHTSNLLLFWLSELELHLFSQLRDFIGIINFVAKFIYPQTEIVGKSVSLFSGQHDLNLMSQGSQHYVSE
jgi:hypothetical protein